MLVGFLGNPWVEEQRGAAVAAELDFVAFVAEDFVVVAAAAAFEIVVALDQRMTDASYLGSSFQQMSRQGSEGSAAAGLKCRDPVANDCSGPNPLENDWKNPNPVAIA